MHGMLQDIARRDTPFDNYVQVHVSACLSHLGARCGGHVEAGVRDLAQDGVGHVSKAIMIQQISCDLPHGRLPHAHCGLQSRLPKLAPHIALHKVCQTFSVGHRERGLQSVARFMGSSPLCAQGGSVLAASQPDRVQQRPACSPWGCWVPGAPHHRAS